MKRKILPIFLVVLFFAFSANAQKVTSSLFAQNIDKQEQVTVKKQQDKQVDVKKQQEDVKEFTENDVNSNGEKVVVDYNTWNGSNQGLGRTNFSKGIVFEEHFTTQLPTTWTYSNTGWVWDDGSNGYGEPNAYIEATGATYGTMETPVINVGSATSMLLSFDLNHQDYAGDGEFSIWAWDGSTWSSVYVESEDFGTNGGEPINVEIDITTFLNPNLKLRFDWTDDGFAGWYCRISDIVVFFPDPYDAAVTELVTPFENFAPGTTDITAVLTNAGTYTMTACDINYSVFNAETGMSVGTGTYSWTGSVDFYDSEEVTVGTFVADAETTYTISVTADLTGDNVASNNTINETVTSAKVYVAPYIQQFTAGYPAEDWTEAQGLYTPTTTLLGDASAWTSGAFANATDACARINIYGDSKNDWMFTPFIDLGAPGHTATLDFNLALTPWMGTTVGAFDDDDVFAVVISTDGGLTWTPDNALLTYTSTHTFSLDEEVSIDLSAYSGLVKFGFYAESTVSESDNDLFVDNVIVAEHFDHDLAVVATTPTTGMPGFSYSPTVTLYNFGNNDETSYTVTVEITDAITGVSAYSHSQDFTYSITSGSDYVAQMATSWSPAEVGTFSITASVDLVGDAFLANNVYEGEITIAYLMGTYTATTCGANFYDSQGPNGNYNAGESFQMTVYPETAGNMVQVYFDMYEVEGYSYDYLTIYNGEDTNAEILDSQLGVSDDDYFEGKTITALNPTGALTFTVTAQFNNSSASDTITVTDSYFTKHIQ